MDDSSAQSAFSSASFAAVGLTQYDPDLDAERHRQTLALFPADTSAEDYLWEIVEARETLAPGVSNAPETSADGIQAGEKGSGLGTITVSGGKVAVSAGKRALHARGSLTLDGGTVLFCAGAAGQEEPGGALPHLFERVPGTAGDRLSLDGSDLGLEAAGSFLIAFYADASLVRGQSYTFAFGPRSVYAAAK